MNFTVRRLHAADVDAYIALRREMLLDAPHAFLASPDDDRASDPVLVKGRLQVDDGLNATFGAFGPDLFGAVGCIGAHHAKSAHIAHIWGMYVTAARRRSGAALGLMQAVIAHARTHRPITQLSLSVSVRSPGAQRLYEKLGFRLWGTEPNAMCIDGDLLDENHMVLLL